MHANIAVELTLEFLWNSFANDIFDGIVVEFEFNINWQNIHYFHNHFIPVNQYSRIQPSAFKDLLDMRSKHNNFLLSTLVVKHHYASQLVVTCATHKHIIAGFT